MIANNSNRPYSTRACLRGPEQLETRVVPSFLAPVSYGVDEYVLSVVNADFNADGFADLATANQDSDTVSVLINAGNGTFGASTSYAAGPNPDGLAVGNFDGINGLDLAVANNTGPNGSVTILLNNGNGTFLPGGSYSVGSSVAAARVAVGDFNADAITDLVTVNRVGSNQTSVSMLRGNGNGTFNAPLTFPLGSIGWGADIAVGLVNGDNRPDVVAIGLGGIGVLFGTGSGIGRLRVSSVQSHSPITRVVLHDINLDGNLDMILGGNSSWTRLGNGSGGFQPSVELVDAGTSGVAIGDFNGDGKPDTAVTHFPDTLSVLLGNGDGTFQSPLEFSPGPDGGPITVGFFNNDAFLDIAVGNQESASVSVLLNDTIW